MSIIGNNEFFYKHINVTEIGRGLKGILSDTGFYSAITQITTCTFNKSNNKYVWGIFNILVLMGIGVVVL